ncbi:MAG: putative glycoside hydrolase [Terriglobales bacterium]
MLRTARLYLTAGYLALFSFALALLVLGRVAPPPLIAAELRPAVAVAQVPQDTTVFTAERLLSVPSLVSRYLPRTKYMTGAELEKALREANPTLKGLWIKPGQSVIIPGYEPEISEKPVSVPKDFEARAIYLTGTMAGSARGLELVRQWRRMGGNAVVFDVKDSDGLINVGWDNPLLHASAVYPMESPLAGRVTPPLRNLAKYVRWLHSLEMHAIARIAIFRDEYLVTHHPELGVRSRATGNVWRENGKLVWVDPSHPDVQAYNIALARFAAESGVDEIQFDYVRFPAEGDQKDAQFAFEKTQPKWQRSDVLNDFLANAHQQLKPLGVLFSLDVFGVMAWQRSVDLAHTGQDIRQMARHCDVLSPMIYPSHFFGMDNIKSPGDAPEHFISESMDKFRVITKDSGVILRPWLQAFGWRTSTYSPAYIMTQVKVAKEKGGIGFMLWNARNDYSKPFTAMPEMRVRTGQFFRGDEIKDRKPILVSVAELKPEAKPAEVNVAKK